jgi:hypothetical protein
MNARSIKSIWYLFGIFFIYAVAAAAAFNEFYDRHSFGEAMPHASAEHIVNQTAARPFVYRQLIPVLIRTVGNILPDDFLSMRGVRFLFNSMKSRCEVSRVRCSGLDDPLWAKERLLLYYVCYAAFLASLFVMRSVCLNEGAAEWVATVVPLVFALMHALLQTVGGYFYDFTELIFLSGAVLATQRKNGFLTILVVALGTLNKESFIFFVPALYPLLLRTHTTSRSRAIFASSLIASIAISLYIRYIYKDNSGGIVEYYLSENISHLTRLSSYFLFEVRYGIPLPQGSNIFSLLLIAGIFGYGWKTLDAAWKRHIFYMSIVNSVVFLLFGFPGELRGFSLMYMCLIVTAARMMQSAADPERAIR